VYSFEEAMYHVFHHWRESVDEFLSEKMIAWVAELGHTYFASKMKELSRKETFSAKILDFLKLTNYFADNELSALKITLDEWELRREWEQLKERGDFFARKNEPHKAIPLYKRALQFEENATLLNNLAIQYMQTDAAREGLSCLTRALSLEPKNFSILLNYIEAAILNGSFDKAAKAIKKAYEINPQHADIAFLLGLLSAGQKDYSTALTYFEKAMDMDKTVAYYAFKAVDIHLQLRQFQKAMETLQKTIARDAQFFAKEAEIYAAWGDISRAIKSLNVAVSTNNDAALYARLAAYHRRDYNTAAAEAAINKALLISPENNTVRLENARIKKGLGRTREYQAVLNEILLSFKESYRIKAN
jgi:tetratricopeptide (TPR) repeat protein